MFESSSTRMDGCPGCGAPIDFDAKCCHACGIPLPVVFCTCGASSPRGARFCADCGRHLSAEAMSGASAKRIGTDELRPVTVLVTDLVDSTGIADQLGPEEFREFLRAMQRIVAPQIERFGGYIAQYVGDGILAFFGYPSSRDNHARSAILAGLSILRHMESFSDWSPKRISLRPQIRIGCHTGPLIVDASPVPGPLSPAEGAAIAIATRLQSVADPGALLISGDTFRLVENFFDVEPLGSRLLKGVPAETATYRVRRRRSEVRAPESPGRRKELIGRDSELEILLEAHRRCEQGLGRAVIVTGQAGIGKSHLIGELRRSLRNAFSILLQCDEAFRRTSFAPFADLITSDLQLHAETEGSQGHSPGDLGAFLEAQGLDAAQAPAVELLLNSHQGVSQDPVATSQVIKDFLLAYILRRREQATTLIVEDMHWCDPSTKDILIDLIAEGPRPGLFILMSARSDSLESSWLSRNVSVLNLPPMNDVHARQLLSNLDLESALDEAAVELLVRRSDGIPLFIEECFRAIVESSASSAGILDVPQRLQGVIWYRLDQLGEFKWIAQLASVSAQTFSLDILEEAVRRIANEADPLPRLQAAINSLERAELISVHPESGRRRFRFRHALIHKAAYESLPGTTRRAWHAVMADVIEAASAKGLMAASTEALARHRSAAEQPEQAAKAYHKAGEEAMGRFANQEAIALLSAEIEEARKMVSEGESIRCQLGARLALNASIIACHGWAARELEVNGAELLAVARRSDMPGHAFEAHRMLLNVALLRADARAASLHLAGMERSLAAEQFADGDMVLDRCAGAKYLFLDGDIRGADEALCRALSKFDPQRHRVGTGLYDLDNEICVRSLQSWLRWFSGDSAEAVRASHHVIDLARRVDHPFSLAYALCLGGSALLSAGETKSVLECAVEVQALAEKYAMSYWSAYAEILRGGGTINHDAAAAVETLRNARQLYRNTRARMLEPWISVLEARALTRLGRKAEARELLQTTPTYDTLLFTGLVEEAQG